MAARMSSYKEAFRSLWWHRWQETASISLITSPLAPCQPDQDIPNHTKKWRLQFQNFRMVTLEFKAFPPI